MGIITALTPGMKQTRSVPRISATAEDVAAVGKIDKHYKPLNSTKSMVYQELPTIDQLQGSNMEVRSFFGKSHCPSVHQGRGVLE